MIFVRFEESFLVSGGEGYQSTLNYSDRGHAGGDPGYHSQGDF